MLKLKLKLNETIIAVLNFAELDILWHYPAIVFDYSNRVLTRAWYIYLIGIVHIESNWLWINTLDCFSVISVNISKSQGIKVEKIGMRLKDNASCIADYTKLPCCLNKINL